jgi:uncharacterized SAM-binding protein YcdF (DUF218 family)
MLDKQGSTGRRSFMGQIEHLTVQGARQPAARVWRLAFAAVCVGLLVTAAGFAWFVMRVQGSEAAMTDSADGVVVLTGGRERIGDAIDLLAAGRGKRLLITGVNPTTRIEELSRLVPRFGPMLACCIDIDRSATNTIGNAVETRRWARLRGFHSLIVVTSNYHMPRAMAELANQLPDVTLIPYSVVIERQSTEPWWNQGTTTKTLAIEYVKYIAALVRMRIGLDPLVDDSPARASARN